MYLFRKLRIKLGSLSKEGLYDLGLFGRSRFKAHTVVKDETWISVRIVFAADVRSSNAIISNINGGLQSFQQWIKSS